MKNLLMLAVLLFSSAIFAEETIIQSAPQEIVISKSEDKNVDRFYYNFGTVPQGTISQARYYVTNNGDYPVYMRNARIGGPGFYAFHNCNVLPPRGGRCSFTIEFRPWYEGYYSGQFSMSFDPDYTVIVQLAGQAFRY